MKKMIALMLSVVVGLTVVGCGNEGESKSKEEKFTIGFDASFPPYGYKDEKTGEYVGFDLDLAQEVADRNGWELVKTPIDWDAKDMELKSGAIDCIWNGFTINGREDDYTWSDPYVDNSQVVVVLANSGITSLADLADKNVIVQADSSALHALEGEDLATLKDSFKELIIVPEYNSAFLSLEAGAADAVALDVGVAEFQLESRETEFVILDESIASEKYGIGFALGNKERRDEVQKTLNEMVEDGKFMEIAKKWGTDSAVCLGK